MFSCVGRLRFDQSNGVRETMSTCAACGDSLPADRPARYLTLEIEDRTRSTRQFMGDETNVKRLCLNRELCDNCWEEYSAMLS